MNPKSFTLFCFIVLSPACVAQQRNFDAEAWRAGGKSVRGSMVNNIKDRAILNGKSKTEVEQLLGKPDSVSENSLNYEVVTISRCYFWECIMEVVFDSQTGKTKGDVDVSD